MSQRVMIVAGPTASGKSTFALEEATLGQGVIINGDSLQLYKGLPILTATPSVEEQAQVPHLLYEIFPSNAPQTSASQWREKAIEAIEKTLQQNKTPWIVGGTGFYLRTLLEGLSPMPQIPEEVKKAFNIQTTPLDTPELFQRLKEKDPPMAGRLSPRDRQRILRALSVWEATGKSLSYWQSQPRKKAPYRFCTLLLSPPRSQLQQRIFSRFQKMLQQGVLKEVEGFLKTEGAESSPLASAIGFSQIQGVLKKELCQEEAFEKIYFATRQYAKRQETWFRHQLRVDITLSKPQDFLTWKKKL